MVPARYSYSRAALAFPMVLAALPASQVATIRR